MKETDKTVMVIAGGTWQVPLIKKVIRIYMKILPALPFLIIRL